MPMGVMDHGTHAITSTPLGIPNLPLKSSNMARASGARSRRTKFSTSGISNHSAIQWVTLLCTLCLSLQRVGLAALLTGHIDARGKTIVIVLSGGNVDADLFAKLVA